MDFFFCIPMIFGCQTKISPDGGQVPRICPRCHNAAVTSAKSKEWFEFCFVPLIPMGSSHIWICSICQWSQAIQQGGWEPQPVTSVPVQPGGYYPPQPQPTWQGAPPAPSNQSYPSNQGQYKPQ
ncbi:hypothetical protein CPC08DRAFT_703129 [Agrocybe pediades]|nr:hypothetical protein CPC08DRAFT_703129 [Agrocybe pediades]